jgi:hypothetical protein
MIHGKSGLLLNSMPCCARRGLKRRFQERFCMKNEMACIGARLAGNPFFLLEQSSNQELVGRHLIKHCRAQ